MKKAWLLAAVAAFALNGAVEAKTLKWGSAREIASLDPYSYGETFTLAVLNHVYEGLVRYTGDLKIEPALAESWSVSDDQRTYTFKLRKGVKFQKTDFFSPSRDLTADDVVFSFERQLKKDNPWYKYVDGAAWEYSDGMGFPDLIKSVE